MNSEKVFDVAFCHGKKHFIVKNYEISLTFVFLEGIIIYYFI